MYKSGTIILSIDAGNGSNIILRKPALKTIHEKVPEIHLTSVNTYGSPSYTLMNGTKCPVEEGGSQGCPHAGTFFNLGLSKLIDSAAQKLSARSVFFYDDGYVYGS